MAQMRSAIEIVHTVEVAGAAPPAVNLDRDYNSAA